MQLRGLIMPRQYSIQFRMKNKKSLQYEMERGMSSANMINMSMNSPRFETSLSRRESMHASSYHSLYSKQLRIGLPIQQQSALPPSNKDYSFLALFPFVIFSVMKQVHVIYLIILSAFMLIKYCSIGWEVLTLQLGLTLVYIVMEIVGRYFTFQFYTKPHFFNDAECYSWNWKLKTWVSIEQSEIKVGEIIKIQQKNKILTTAMEQSQQPDQLRIRVPVNILPLKVFSGSNQIGIETFDTDKKQAQIKIPIIKNFDKYFLETNKYKQIQYVKPKIFDECIIRYTFSNPISESFEADICFLADSIDKKISNEDIIPRGAYFCNQQQLVGVVLYNLEQKNERHFKHILGSRNSIAILLQKHLLIIIGINIIISMLLIALDAIVSAAWIHNVFQWHFHCYFFDAFALLSFSMNVLMYIILGMHQIIDSFLIRKKCKVHMNNYIKSIDQFGVADTFVVDEFTFVKKSILQVVSIQINSQEGTERFDQQLILLLVQKSKQFQTKYHMQWLSLNDFFKSKYGRGNLKKRDSISIINERIDMSGSIRLKVMFQKYKFIVRFNQKVIFSVLQSISIQKQWKFHQKISQGRQNGELMLMVEILELKNDAQQEQINGSIALLQMEFKFLSLIRFRFTPHSSAVDFLKYLKNKYKIIVMSSNTYEYFEKVLVTAGLKKLNDYVMIFEETEQNDFQKQLAQKIDEFKKIKFRENKQQQRLRKGSYVYSDENAVLSEQVNSSLRKTYGGNVNQNDQSGNGDLILALHSSLIIYISRPRIRELLQQLSKISVYIIFYQCSQFQKQLCAANVFKIFPQHIYLSNFAIDANIFRISNLSVCISGHSAQRYSTATASSFRSLQKFISKQCVTSIELTTIIIKTHIFKNQCLIWSMISSMLFIYQAHYNYVSQQYSTFMLYLYNAAFTILPIIYYLIARPQLLGDIVVEDYKDYKLRYQHFKGLVSGVIITYLTFSIVPQSELNHVFIAVMINCTFMANFYHLVIDDSAQKRWQIIIIIIQCIISIGIYFLTLFFEPIHTLFYTNWDLNPDVRYMVLYFCTIFLLNPFIIFMLFLFMSFHKSIFVKDRRTEKKQLEYQQIKSSIKKQQIIARVGKSSGKQMKFRGLDIRPQFF